MKHVFVYGTLKRGGSNHRFLRGQRLVGTAETQPHYRLYGLDGYPGLVEVVPGTGLPVKGEIWAVDEACLAELDRLEGVAEGLYRRGEILLSPPRTPSVEAYYYLGDVAGRAALGDDFPVDSK